MGWRDTRLEQAQRESLSLRASRSGKPPNREEPAQLQFQLDTLVFSPVISPGVTPRAEPPSAGYTDSARFGSDVVGGCCDRR